MLGAGLLLGVGVMHLLVDGVLEFDTASIEEETNGYPFTFATFLFGIIFMMGMQMVTAYALSDALTEETHTAPSSNHFTLDEQPHKAKTGLSISKIISFEASIVLHSVIIGFGFGVTNGEDIPALVALLIALLFHQFFEGMSIGIIVIEAELMENLKLDVTFKYGLLALFVLSTPIGIVIGILTEATTDGDMISSIFNCFAAGLLMYGVLVEVVASEMAVQPTTKNGMWVKAQRYGAFVLGCLSMSVLAVWASRAERVCFERKGMRA